MNVNSYLLWVKGFLKQQKNPKPNPQIFEREATGSCKVFINKSFLSLISHHFCIIQQLPSHIFTKGIHMFT